MRRTSDTAVGPAPRIRGRCATARRPAGRLRCRGRRRAPRPIRDTATPVAGGLPADASRSATPASTSGVSAVAGLDRGLEAAVSLYRGELLPGLYDNWIVAERERLGGLLVRSLRHLVDLLEERREYRRAIDDAEHLLRQDQLDETS